MCIWFSKGDLYEQIKKTVLCIVFIQRTVTIKKLFNPANIIMKKQVEELTTVLQSALPFLLLIFLILLRYFPYSPQDVLLELSQKVSMYHKAYSRYGSNTSIPFLK